MRFSFFDYETRLDLFYLTFGSFTMEKLNIFISITTNHLLIDIELIKLCDIVLIILLYAILHNPNYELFRKLETVQLHTYYKTHNF